MAEVKKKTKKTTSKKTTSTKTTTPRKKKEPENQWKYDPSKPLIAVTEDEYDADPEKFREMENVVIFMDEWDREAFVGGGLTPRDDLPDWF